jgi:hypothetical protein
MERPTFDRPKQTTGWPLWPSLLLFALLLSACKFNPNIQDEGAPFLQGSWTETRADQQDSLLRYQLHDFRFDCDSVYIQIRTHARTKMEADSCYGDGEWTEYARGIYIVRNDSLFIEATYTHDNWKQKLSGCHHIGQYLPRFAITKQEEDSLELQNFYSKVPIRLARTAQSNCVPKQVY